MELGLLFALATAVYFIPSFIGTKKANSTSIFLLNLLLGWTLVGWVVALVWATTQEPPVAPPPAPQAPMPGALPVDPHAAIARLRDLRDRGVISQEEFMQGISRL